jgi:hypothetical protein
LKSTEKDPSKSGQMNDKALKKYTTSRQMIDKALKKSTTSRQMLDIALKKSTTNGQILEKALKKIPVLATCERVGTVNPTTFSQMHVFDI